MSLGGIFQQDKVVLAAYLHQGGQVSRVPGEMDRHYRPRPGGDSRFDRRRVERKRGRVNIGKAQADPGEQHRGRAGEKGIGRHNHFIGGVFDARRLQRCRQRKGAVRHRHAVFSAVPGREFTFKFGYTRIITAPFTAVQNFQQARFFFRAGLGPGRKSRGVRRPAE